MVGYRRQTHHASPPHTPINSGNSGIKVVRIDGTFVRHIGTGVRGLGDDEFTCPWGVAALPDGTLAVSDNGNNRIKVVRVDGTLIRHIGVKGACDDEFDGPTGIMALPDGTIVVADSVNHRLCVLS